jgi:hypothetical protein
MMKLDGNALASNVTFKTGPRSTNRYTARFKAHNLGFDMKTRSVRIYGQEPSDKERGVDIRVELSFDALTDLVGFVLRSIPKLAEESN